MDGGTNMNNMMLEYDINKDPGIGAYFGGQKHASELQNSAVARMLQESQAKNIQERLKMDQAEHPLKLEGLRAENEGKVLSNTRTRGQITDEENQRRQKATDAFFKYINENPDDPEGAFVVSGVPRTGKFLEFAQSPQEQRQKLIDLWRQNRAAEAEMKAKNDSERQIAAQAVQDASAANREKLRDDRQAALQRELEQMRINAGKYQKQSTLKIGFTNELAAAKTAMQKMAVLNQYKILSERDPDLAEQAEMIKQMMIQLTPQYQAEVQARQNPQAIDLPAAASGRGVRPVSPPQAYPPMDPRQDPNRANDPATIPMPAGAVRPRY
jgi:hypothetical protein